MFDSSSYLNTIKASFISCIHYDDLFDRIQVYLRLQKIAKQNPKYYSKLSSGPFAWKSINESWGQKVKPCSKFFPNVCYLFSQFSQAGIVSRKGHKFSAYGLELAQPFLNTIFLLSRTGKKK